MHKTSPIVLVLVLETAGTAGTAGTTDGGATGIDR